MQRLVECASVAALVSVIAPSNENDIVRPRHELTACFTKESLEPPRLVGERSIEPHGHNNAITRPCGEHPRAAGHGLSVRTIIGSEDELIADACLCEERSHFRDEALDRPWRCGPAHSDEERPSHAFDVAHASGDNECEGLIVARWCPALDVKVKRIAATAHVEIGGAAIVGRHLKFNRAARIEQSVSDRGLDDRRSRVFVSSSAIECCNESLQAASWWRVRAIREASDQRCSEPLPKFVTLSVALFFSVGSHR